MESRESNLHIETSNRIIETIETKTKQCGQQDKKSAG